jgi:hypothetical protein
MTKNRAVAHFVAPVAAAPAAVSTETEEEILARLETRFSAMDLMTHATCFGHNRSLIISGPAGLGKSYGVMKTLEEAESRGLVPIVVKGYIRPTGLYKLLYENRFKKCIVVFDDADSIFSDDVCLNLLKAACDMTETRRLHWLTETKMEDEDGERLPRNFEFEGSIIFITNYDFDDLIAKGNKLAPHFEALISRSHYLDLAMKTKKDYVVRIKQVVFGKGMLRREGFSATDEKEIVSFVESNTDKLRELSLRMVVKLAGLLRMNRSNWKDLAAVTCMR